MINNDVTLCSLLYSGNAKTDKFVCEDRYPIERELPPLQKLQDCKILWQNVNYYEENKTASVTVHFVRNMTTNDPKGYHHQFKEGAKMDYAWAYGLVMQSVPTKHLERGGGQLNI